MSEPSMEDILASIRRIIAADQTGGPIRGGFAPPAQPEAEGGTARAEAPQVDVAAPRSSAAPDVAVDPSGRDDWAVPVQPPRYPHLHEADDAATPPHLRIDDPIEMAVERHQDVSQRGVDHQDRLEQRDSLYPTADDEAVVSGHYDLQESDVVDPASVVEPLLSSAAGASISSSFHALAQTVLLNDPDMIERVARDALRPMLRAWLDENLPSMVERLVRTEIERVARGGRSRD